MIILNVLFWFFLIGVIFSSMILFRNEKVNDERKRIIDMCYYNLGDDYDTYVKAVDYYDSVTYNEMLYTFWKPIKSFYDYSKFEK